MTFQKGHPQYSKYRFPKGMIAWNKGMRCDWIKRDRKGKTYEEIFGEEKAKQMKIRMSLAKKGKPCDWIKTKWKKGYGLGDSNIAKRMDIRLKLAGENHHAWLGGKSFEPYNKNFNQIFKDLIILRDNNCIICGSNNKLCVHHINYNKLNTIKENCICLCKNCHTRTNFNRDHWVKFFQSLLSEKYNYIYLNFEVKEIGL